VANFKGYLKIERTGPYHFWTRSNDGSELLINGSLVVNNNNPHWMRTKHGTKYLQAGQTAKIEVWFFEQRGSAGLEVKWSGPGFSKQLISSNSVTHTGDLIQLRAKTEEAWEDYHFAKVKVDSTIRGGSSGDSSQTVDPKLYKNMICSAEIGSSKKECCMSKGLLSANGRSQMSDLIMF